MLPPLLLLLLLLPLHTEAGNPARMAWSRVGDLEAPLRVLTIHAEAEADSEAAPVYQTGARPHPWAHRSHPWARCSHS
jgi:hypothetical protein